MDVPAALYSNVKCRLPVVRDVLVGLSGQAWAGMDDVATTFKPLLKQALEAYCEAHPNKEVGDALMQYTCTPALVCMCVCVGARGGGGCVPGW